MEILYETGQEEHLSTSTTLTDTSGVEKADQHETQRVTCLFVLRENRQLAEEDACQRRSNLTKNTHLSGEKRTYQRSTMSDMPSGL